MLKNKVLSFIEKLEKKTILKPLYRNREMVVLINDGPHSLAIIFHDGKCTIEDDELQVASLTEDVFVKGEIENLEKLMDGSERLMKLIETGAITARGNSTQLLSLESLLLLSAPTSVLRHDHA